MEQEMYMFYQLDLEGNLILNEDSEPIELVKPVCKGLDDIELVVKHNPLNNLAINKFIELYDLGIQWNWFYKYQEWIRAKLKFEEYVSTLPVEDKDGNTLILPEFNLQEPIRPNRNTVDYYKENILIDGFSINEYIFRYKRSTEVHSITVEVDGLVFDGDEASQRRMLSAINAAETLGLNTTPWRLADNSIVDVTKQQLVEAHAKAILKQGALWLP